MRFRLTDAFKCCAAFALVTGHASSVAAKEATTDKAPVVLKVGDKAPHFHGESDELKAGNPVLWRSKDRVGKKILVVYFYPADMTGGCTKQACNYRDALMKLDRKDVEVVGVSGDTVENHRHFRDQYKLNYTLLADPEGKIAATFGVKLGAGGAIEREINGEMITLKRGVTANRWTFVIGPDNTILHIDQKVRPAEDSKNVLKVIAKVPEIKVPIKQEGETDKRTSKLQ